MKVKEKITDANMMHMYYELFKRFLSSLKWGTNFPTIANNFRLSSALQGKYAAASTEALWRPKESDLSLTDPKGK